MLCTAPWKGPWASFFDGSPSPTVARSSDPTQQVGVQAGWRSRALLPWGGEGV